MTSRHGTGTLPIFLNSGIANKSQHRKRINPNKPEPVPLHQEKVGGQNLNPPAPLHNQLNAKNDLIFSFSFIKILTIPDPVTYGSSPTKVGVAKNHGEMDRFFGYNTV